MSGIYYKSALLIIYFGQGIIFSLALFILSSKTGDRSLKWLGTLVFLSCLYVAPWMLGHANWYSIDGYREFLFFFPFHQLFLFGPIIYFYIRQLIKPEFELKGHDYLHFAPAVLYFVYSLIVFITDFFVLDEFYFYADGRDKDLSPWYQITGTISIIVYSLLGYKNYESYKSRIINEVSYAESIKFTWLKRFLISLLAILLLRVFFLVALPDWGNFGLKWWYYLAFAATFYYITFAGYTNGILASFHFQPVPADITEEIKDQVKSLQSTEVEELKKQIDSYVIEMKAFRNSRLTLKDVADHLNTNVRNISQAINQGFQMNFNDYVNDARLSELKSRIDNGDHLRFTLLSLAMDCGFNSKSTFNRVFKNRMKTTPNDYLKNIK